MFQDHIGLIQTELIAQNIVGAQQIHSSNWIVEVVLVVRIQCEIDGRIPQKIERLLIFGSYRRSF
jgi:hypothetical protein